MRLFVTIAEETPEAALSAIGALRQDHDGVEVRVERFTAFDPAAFRSATSRPIILTRRGAAQEPREVTRALEAGIDLVDVEFGEGLEWLEPFRSRVVLSHHDYESMPDVVTLLQRMRDYRCIHTKLAVTPRTLADNLRLLEQSAPGTTLIGMGERGMFSRLLAPFRGSELAFVSADVARSAAPGQIDLARALDIYGSDRAVLRADHVFAVTGNPAGHSLSPSIHNPLFRSKGVHAAYTIASTESFREVAEALLRGDLSGVSVTAPFKEEAYAFAVQEGAALGENAVACGAANTLVRLKGRLVADNTDVDGFTHVLARLCGRDRKTVALVGAGGTARAAAVALDRAGMAVIVYNRSAERGRELAGGIGAEYQPLDEIARFDGEIVVNTIPDPALVPLRLAPAMAYVEAAYGAGQRQRIDGVEWIDGVDLLQAQAIRQHELFMRVFDES